jgi:transcriptional regulator with AAA-type ATPase domain
VLLGESGTGKGLLASAIHELSRRRQKLFVDVHCGAVADHLLENELFGHERGAFTGAVSDKPGLFEIADGGTLFLDEFAEMTPEMQIKLLKVVTKAWRRVLKKAKLPAFRLYDLRHTFATTLLAEGAPLTYVAAQWAIRSPPPRSSGTRTGSRAGTSGGSMPWIARGRGRLVANW